jgi:hypothetical protein
MKSLSLLLLIVLAGCSSTRITSSWTAPSAGASDYQKIMVVSRLSKEDSALRRKMEEHMVADLKAIGYKAVAFTTEFKEGELKDIRYDSVRQKLSARHIDGVLTIDLLAKEQERVYVKEKVAVQPGNTPLGSFWEPPARVTQESNRSGYYVTTTQYYWESKFYNVQAVALMYNVQTTAFDAASIPALAHKYGKQIVTDMQKNYLLTAKK